MKKQNILLVPLIGVLIGVAVTMIAKKATASSVDSAVAIEANLQRSHRSANINFGLYGNDIDYDLLCSRDRGRDRSRGGGNVSCRVQEIGWEEHSGGHRSCKSCLKQHGKCRKTCKKSYYVCKAVLKKRNRSRDRNRNVSKDVYKGRAPDSLVAERRALRKCERNNFDYDRRCVILDDCEEISEVISRNRCR